MNILQKAIRSMSSLTGSFNDKLLKYYKQYGATSSVLQDAEKQYLVGRLGNKYYANQDYWKELDETFGDALPLEVSDILRKYGSDAHLYLPGVSPSQGFVPGNYIDSAGTQPAVYDQPVGLVLDAAGSVGVNLTVDANWTNSANVVRSGNQFTLTAATTTLAAQQSIITAGKTYETTLQIESISSGSLSLTLEGGAATTPTYSTVGTYTARLLATHTGNISLYLRSNPCTAVVRILSIKEITGIHASQQTVGYKPIERRGIVNLLTYSNDLTNAAWGIKSSGGTATANSVSFTTDPFGRVLHSYTHTAGDITVAASFNPSDAGKAVRLGIWDSVLDGLTTGGSSSRTIPASGLVVFNITSSGGSGHVGVIGTGVATTLSNPSVAVFQGTLTAAQILAAGGIPLTTTAPASSSAGNAYLEFDGVDDRLDLGGPLFQMSDDHCVVVGFKPDVISEYRAPFFPAVNAVTIARAGVIGVDPGGAIVAYYTNDAGRFFSPQLGTVVANEAFVASVRKVGSQFKGRKNGGAFCAPQTPTGTFTLDTAAIGYAQGFAYADGSIYPMLAIKGTVSDADLLVLEKFVAQLSGVTL